MCQAGPSTVEAAKQQQVLVLVPLHGMCLWHLPVACLHMVLGRAARCKSAIRAQDAEQNCLTHWPLPAAMPGERRVGRFLIPTLLGLCGMSALPAARGADPYPGPNGPGHKNCGGGILHNGWCQAGLYCAENMGVTSQNEWCVPTAAPWRVPWHVPWRAGPGGPVRTFPHPAFHCLCLTALPLNHSKACTQCHGHGSCGRGTNTEDGGGGDGPNGTFCSRVPSLLSCSVPCGRG